MAAVMTAVRPHRLALLVTAALLGVLLGLGLGLQRRRWRVARPVHHVLFFAVTAGVVLAGGLTRRAGGRWAALLPALGGLLLMPCTRPGRAGHWRLALVCAAAFAAGTWGAW